MPVRKVGSRRYPEVIDDTIQAMAKKGGKGGKGGTRKGC